SSDHIQDGQDTVQALIEHNCDINAIECLPPFWGESALNLSISRNQDSITEKLIRSGADVDARSPSGQSPFVRLIKDGKNDLAKMALASSVRTTSLDLAHIENDRAKISQSDPEMFSYLFQERTFFPK